MSVFLAVLCLLFMSASVFVAWMAVGLQEKERRGPRGRDLPMFDCERCHIAIDYGLPYPACGKACMCDPEEEE